MEEEERICPKCQSTEVTYTIHSTTSHIGWEDGLGSPGVIHFESRHYSCKSCKHGWKES